MVVLLAGCFLATRLLTRYTVRWQSPLQVEWQSPVLIEPRGQADEAAADQGSPLTPHQQYACRKFGTACRVALAIQRAENQKGDCEAFHHNTDGSLDWGYFQINTVHLVDRPGLRLRDLLDCRANIDFAHKLYQERGFQPWSTYNSGAYRRFLRP